MGLITRKDIANIQAKRSKNNFHGCFPPYIITTLQKWALVTKDKMASPHENTMYLATRHANYSAALSTEATTTFMFLPSWNLRRMTTNSYTSLCCRFPHICKISGSIPSGQLQSAEIPFWNFTNTLGRCTSLPYGILKAKAASMLATRTG